MGLYVYENPETGEIKEVIQGMNDLHEYSENNTKWNRVWTLPQACIDGKWSIWDEKDFAAKSASKKGTYGDLLDKSAELSQARAEKEGSDPIKEKHFQDYEQRNKKPHPQKLKEVWDKTVVEV